MTASARSSDSGSPTRVRTKPVALELSHSTLLSDSLATAVPQLLVSPAITSAGEPETGRGRLSRIDTETTSTSSRASIPSALSSPCYINAHLDDSLAYGRRQERQRSQDRRSLRQRTAKVSRSSDSESSSEEEGGRNTATSALVETASSVRSMSKELGNATIAPKIRSILIVTKAKDNHLVRATKELAMYLMTTPRNGKDRGLIVYVDGQLKSSKRFDVEGMRRDNPDLFRPLSRRSRSDPSSSSQSASDSPPSSATSSEEGLLRFWDPQLCSDSPHRFDYVVTLGGDGTLLWASWLFQHAVPLTIAFGLGSLGFLAPFAFTEYAKVMTEAIENGVKINLRMRFNCTVFRAVESAQKRRAMKSAKTRDILINSLERTGWSALESGKSSNICDDDKEIKCFSTRAVESFEVLNELVLDRGANPALSLVEVFIDQEHLTTIQADGVVVSTPTGSTAYSLAAGGSLVHPDLPAILLTPICPHSLSFRPILLPDSIQLRLFVPFDARSTVFASFDGKGRVELNPGDHVRVTASTFPFPTVCATASSSDFFEAVSRTLSWNSRPRQGKPFVVLEEDAIDEEEDAIDEEEEAEESYDIVDLSSAPVAAPRPSIGSPRISSARSPRRYSNHSPRQQHRRSGSTGDRAFAVVGTEESSSASESEY